MTRKRRYLFSAAFLVACVGLALAVLLMPPDGSGVTRVNFDRIKNGMTLAEVEAVFGCPPARSYENGACHVWIGSDEATVYIDMLENVVVEKHWHWSTPLYDSIRRWWLPPG